MPFIVKTLIKVYEKIEYTRLKTSIKATLIKSFNKNHLNLSTFTLQKNQIQCKLFVSRYFNFFSSIQSNHLASMWAMISCKLNVHYWKLNPNFFSFFIPFPNRVRKSGLNTKKNHIFWLWIISRSKSLFPRNDNYFRKVVCHVFNFWLIFQFHAVNKQQKLHSSRLDYNTLRQYAQHNI